MQAVLRNLLISGCSSLSPVRSMIFFDDDLHNAKCDDVNDDVLPPMFGK